ncbi:MAG: hypothetical protein AAFX08_01410, partial [Pseudomonadota bacterium]
SLLFPPLQATSALARQTTIKVLIERVAGLLRMMSPIGGLNPALVIERALRWPHGTRNWLAAHQPTIKQSAARSA